MPEQAENYKDTEELHPCPYQQEMNGNDEPYCNCSRARQYECAMDV